MALSIPDGAQAIPTIKKAKCNRYIMLAGGLIGAATFLVLYGFVPLNVLDDVWIFQGYVEWDIVQTYSGWLVFRNAPWMFPLGLSPDFAYPDGALISFTNSGPLVCILLKLINPILPETFQYIGWYNFLAFILQGIAAALILNLFTQAKLVIYPGILLFTFSPILIERAFRHSNLAQHWIILFSIYLYLSSRRTERFQLSWNFLLLSFLAIGIHPYHVPIVYSVLFLTLLEQSIKYKIVIRTGGFLLANFAVTLFTGYVIGTLGHVANLATDGYGLYSMNMNALYSPYSYGGYRWSQLLRVQEQATTGQYDGFNYLGLGCLVFLFFVLLHWFLVRLKKPKPSVTVGQDILRCLRYRWPFFSVCIILFFFALSNQITFNAHTLIQVPLPDIVSRFFNLFQSSGRLFYPVYYFIIIFILRYMIAHYRRPAVNLLVCILVCIQLLDMGSVVVQKHSYFLREPSASLVSDNYIQDLATNGHFSKLIALEHFYDHVAVSVAGKYHWRTNLLNTNRGGTDAIFSSYGKAYQAVIAGDISKDTIYLFKNTQWLGVLQEALADEDVSFYSVNYGDREYHFIIPA